MAERVVKLKVKRQDGPGAETRWEQFAVPYQAHMNVISALMSIQKDPRTAGGQPTTPVNWESSCLEEVCGACTMVINGRARQACSALVDQHLPLSLDESSGRTAVDTQIGIRHTPQPVTQSTQRDSKTQAFRERGLNARKRRQKVRWRTRPRLYPDMVRTDPHNGPACTERPFDQQLAIHPGLTPLKMRIKAILG